MARKFTMYEDDGHGWLAVPRSEIDRLGLVVSSCSYQSRAGTTVYLEEDCDRRNFLEEMKATGNEVLWSRIREVRHEGSSWIRSLPHYEEEKLGSVKEQILSDLVATLSAPPLSEDGA
jgi:hypothetical protein